MNSLDETKMEENKLAVALKLNKLMLNEVKNPKIPDSKKNKVVKDSVLTLYILAKFYKLSTIATSSLNFIERCFPMVVESQNFLDLDFSIVAKILSTSEFNVHSKVEIFVAVITRIKHNSEERSKYAKQLLSKVYIVVRRCIKTYFKL